MTKHLLSHMKQNTIAYIAYLALFVALGGTSYASVNTRQAAKSAKAGITCGGRCPATSVFWAYVGATGGPGAQIDLTKPSVAGPNIYQTAVGGVPANLVHLGLGDWSVRFKSENLSNCSRFVNLTHDRGSATAGGYDHFNTDPQAIRVLTTNAAGQPADLDFVVIAFCGLRKGILSSPAPPGAGVGGQ